MRPSLALCFVACLGLGFLSGELGLAAADEDPGVPAPGKPAPGKPAAGKNVPGKPAAAPRRQHLDLVVDRDEHDFGVVGQNEEISTTFTFTNDSDHIVENIRAAADCGCNLVDLSTKRLEPHAQGTLTVSFQTSVLSGKLQKRVRLWTKDRSRGEIVIRLRIAIVRGLILDPGAVRFADVVQGTTPTARFGVKWREGAGKPFELTKVEIPGHEDQLKAHVSPYVSQGKGDPWHGYVVDVTFLTPPPLGMYSAHVLVRTTDPDSPRIVVPLSANVIGKVWMQARVMHFGVIQEGASRTATLKFRPSNASTLFGDVRASARLGKIQVEVKPDPRHRDEGYWILRATVPDTATAGRLDDEVIELHTGVAGEELILVRVQGRVRARRG